MFKKQQLRAMLELQDGMNSKINPDWLTADSDFLLAAMVETVEGIDHHGWKWWKKQTTDMAQLQMELVDVWHFMLSHHIVEDGSIEGANQHITFEARTSPVAANNDSTLLYNMKMLGGLFGLGASNIGLFLHIVGQAGMTEEDLYKKYVGKNILNFFRQDNGYKEGTYIKVWDGREDNEYLEELLETLDTSEEDYSAHVYGGLQTMYNLLTSKEPA
jgi:dimeric dUTPase (all-alpha-NTP-PPase superfamily)